MCVVYNEVIILDVATKNPWLGLIGSQRRCDNMKPCARVAGCEGR